MKIRLTLTEPILGTCPNNKEIAAEFVASKAPDAAKMQEEIERLGVDAVVEKGKTVFPRLDDGTPFVYDYQIKGFFKDACGMLARVPYKKSAKVKANKKIIDGLIFVEPRTIPFLHYGEITDCQRPLRAQTAQGERVSLANSEEIGAGAQLEFEVICLNTERKEGEDYTEHEKLVCEWLDYGRLRGLGQWRNSGKGRFTYEIIG